MDKTAEILKAIMAAVEPSLPGCAITILVAPFDGPEGARTNYISNARRTDMLACMKEVVSRFEGRAHDAPDERQ